ncbi:MAG TPA: hypothetical protein VD926_11200 [Acidimicrobiales bacterium]|nr:hypothetical protein [Acidimicrobiales bacterium]
MDHRTLARIGATGRIAIGAALLLAPHRVTRSWVGEDGLTPGARLLARGLGGRDLALGLGVLATLDRGDAGARDWIRASALADTADATATLLAFKHLPKWGRVGVLAAAAGFAVAGFVAAERLDD